MVQSSFLSFICTFYIVDLLCYKLDVMASLFEDKCIAHDFVLINKSVKCVSCFRLGFKMLLVRVMEIEISLKDLFME
jgi:hypothetical protein